MCGSRVGEWMVRGDKGTQNERKATQRREELTVQTVMMMTKRENE